MKETTKSFHETYEPENTLTSPSKNLTGGRTSDGGRWRWRWRREGFQLSFFGFRLVSSDVKAEAERSVRKILTLKTFFLFFDHDERYIFRKLVFWPKMIY